VTNDTRLFPIILRRDYFYDYLLDYFPIMSDYARLFFRLFTIISWCRHPENGTQIIRASARCADSTEFKLNLYSCTKPASEYVLRRTAFPY
jgi:hypothetical protein